MVCELGGCGIIVNIIVFGVIVIDFGGGLVWDDVEVNVQFVVMMVLGWVGVFEDIGLMIVSLLCDDNCWVIVQWIEVLGG